MIRRLAATALAAGAGVLLALASAPPPPASAVGAADAIGEYDLRLRGEGFDRNATSGRVSEGRLKGRALLRVLRAESGGDPRELAVEIVLDDSLDGSLLDRATPTPALAGRGVLVGDSLSVIGAGQANYVSAITLRFAKSGRKVEGWWVTSYPGEDAASGYVAGLGLGFKGKRLRKSGVGATGASALSSRR